MSRFLSPEWFEDVRAHQEPLTAPLDGESLVVEQIVRSTPDGEVRYRVVVAGGRAVVADPDNDADPDITIGCEWSTATALASGSLAAQAALLEGRLRVSGDLTRVAGKAAELLGIDAVPPEVRGRTTF